MSEEVYNIAIPIEWKSVYDNLSHKMTKYGYDMLMDCNACCKDKNVQLLRCYTLFESAVSAYNIGEETLANNLILEIKSRLNNLNIN